MLRKGVVAFRTCLTAAIQPLTRLASHSRRRFVMEEALNLTPPGIPPQHVAVLRNIEARRILAQGSRATLKGLMICY